MYIHFTYLTCVQVNKRDLNQESNTFPVLGSFDLIGIMLTWPSQGTEFWNHSSYLDSILFIFSIVKSNVDMYLPGYWIFEPFQLPLIGCYLYSSLSRGNWDCAVSALCCFHCSCTPCFTGCVF